MSRLVEFPLQDGGVILVQVDEAAAGPVTRGLGDRRLVTEQAHQTFEQAIARVQPAAQALISRLRALADTPDEVGVEFGLELSAEAGAFIAAASSTANFKVTLSWRRVSPPPTAAPADMADRIWQIGSNRLTGGSDAEGANLQELRCALGARRRGCLSGPSTPSPGWGGRTGGLQHAV
jgi:hypothetical protein